jgi:hypothetical protein
MNHLREMRDTRQIPGEPRRRWFCSPELDLIVWIDDDAGRPLGFQLCYDKLIGERALTWREGRGYDHSAVDNGESMPTKYKGTPILVADGVFQQDRIAAVFEDASSEIPADIRAFVTEKLTRYPEE